jgi:hypothetical protein
MESVRSDTDEPNDASSAPPDIDAESLMTFFKNFSVSKSPNFFSHFS